jgi:hypothetical protein
MDRKLSNILRSRGWPRGRYIPIGFRALQGTPDSSHDCRQEREKNNSKSPSTQTQRVEMPGASLCQNCSTLNGTPLGRKTFKRFKPRITEPSAIREQENNYMRTRGVTIENVNHKGRLMSFTCEVEPSIARELSQARSCLSYQHHNPRTDPCRSSNFNVSLMKTGRRLRDRHAPQLVQRLPSR